MATNKQNRASDAADGKIQDMDLYVYNAYKNQIRYYWNKGTYNKKAYKNYRFLIIVLGALVTLIASLSTSEIIAGGNPFIKGLFTLGTPALAAALTIINGLSQNFQWGATWRDMSVNASRLEKERDRFLATPVEKRNHQRELEIINQIVLEETNAFFKRIMDSESVPTTSPGESVDE